MGLTVEQIVRINDKACREAWEKEAASLRKASEELRETLAAVAKAVGTPISEGGLSEVYVGAGWFLESDCRKVVEQYRRLEEIKRAAAVFTALIEAMEEE